MAGVTDTESRILLAHAIVEIADGTPGLGVNHARALVALADAGRIADPMQPMTLPPKPKVPFQSAPITNESLDGANRAPAAPGPPRGSAAWFAARKARVKA